MNDWVVGVDLGATKIEVGLVGQQNQILSRQRMPTRSIEGPQKVVERITQKVEELSRLLPAGEKIAALGICSPGPVDNQAGSLIDPPNLPGLHNAPLRQMLSDRLNIPVCLEHDAKATALGEYYFGAGLGEDDMVYTIIGTGVGAAIIQNGQLMRGKDNSAGEIGHITLDRNGELCSCGGRGCVETYMSGPWLVKHYRKALIQQAGGDASLVDTDDITGEKVALLAAGGDPLAKQVVTDAGEALGITVAIMAMVLNIDLFVFGSSISKLGDLLLEPARRMILNHTFRSVGCGVRLVTSELMDDGPILGCAWMARQLIKASPPKPAALVPMLTLSDDIDRLKRVQGTIIEIQRFTVHDGPGIRTAVFFKGCSLRCEWCSNPETQRPRPELAFSSRLCINCGQFADPCGDSWANGAETQASREKYGDRTELCPTCGIHWLGTKRSAGDIIEEVLSDRIFYRDKGGVTLTGGEPTYQPRLAEALLCLAKLNGLDTAIETSGHTRYNILERILPYLDLILFDIKNMDATKHKKYTGVDNTLILTNLEKLVANRAPVQIRVPLIPEFNADEDSLAAIADYVNRLEGLEKKLTLLPFHKLAQAKYKSLGRSYPWGCHERLSEERIEALADVMRSRGLEITVGG